MTIDKEFKELIPPLSAEEFEQLEQNILKDGVRDSLVIWDNDGEWVLIDGHNRYEIAKKHNLPYNTKRMTFDSRDDVKEWIILNQFGRRNLPAFVRAQLALKLKPVIAAKAKENQGTRTDLCQKSDKSMDTKKELAKVAGVSHDTIHKVETIMEKGSEIIQEQCKSGDMTINRAYNMIKGAEREVIQQQEAAELRDAKKRHKELAEQKSEGIVSIEAVKQDQTDSKLIFKEFKEEIRLIGNKVLPIGGKIARDQLKDILRGGDKYDLRDLEEQLRSYASVITQTRRLIEEVYHEKQSSGNI